MNNRHFGRRCGHQGSACRRFHSCNLGEYMSALFAPLNPRFEYMSAHFRREMVTDVLAARSSARAMVTHVLAAQSRRPQQSLMYSQQYGGDGRPRLHAQALKDSVHMTLNGFGSHPNRGRDLGIRLASHQAERDIALPGRE